jgi:hypothetical protein
MRNMLVGDYPEQDRQDVDVGVVPLGNRGGSLLQHAVLAQDLLQLILAFHDPRYGGRTTPTLPVFVMRMGVSSTPLSSIQCVPVMSPLPFPAK